MALSLERGHRKLGPHWPVIRPYHNKFLNLFNKYQRYYLDQISCYSDLGENIAATLFEFEASLHWPDGRLSSK